MRFEKVYRKRLKKFVWRFDGYISGVRYSDSGFESKAEAEEAVAALRLRARREKYGLPQDRPLVTLAALVAERKKDLNPQFKGHRRCLAVLESFRDHFEVGFDVEKLSTADVRSYIQARCATREGGLKPNSINRELIYISAMLNAAGRYFPSLEHWKPPRLPYAPTSERGRERVITRGEADRLLEWMRAPRRSGEKPQTHQARVDVADLLEVALMTGMRNSEIRTLTWEKIDFENDLIHLTKTKTVPRIVPMNEDVKAILKRRQAVSISRFIFPGEDGKSPRTVIYKVIQRAAEKAKVTYGQRVEGGFTLHDARHTATTQLLHAGTDLSTTMDILGHSQKTMTLKYSHATLESRRRAVGSLRRYLNQTEVNNNLSTENGALKSTGAEHNDTNR